MKTPSTLLSCLALASATVLAACSSSSGALHDSGTTTGSTPPGTGGQSGPGSGGAPGNPPGTGGALGSPPGNPAGTGGAPGNSAGTGGAVGNPAGTGGAQGCAGLSGNPQPGSGGSQATDAGATQGAGGASGPYVKPPPAPSAGCGKAAGGTGAQTINVMGRNVNYIVNMTGYDNTMPNKLIFTLHGCGGYGSLIILPGLAPNIHVQWQGSDSGCYSDQTRASPEYAVFDALLDYMENNYCIDKNRVFATGFSSGSWMADMLGCQRANVVKAHGQGAGGLPVSIRPAADCRGPEAALYEHGTADDQNHIHGSRQDRDRLLKTNQCDSTSKPYPNFSPCVLYDNCLPGFPVAYCEIPGLAHSQWPQMAAVVANFFQQF